MRQLTNSAGQVTLAKAYDPYGNVVSSVGSGTSPFAYTGEQQDASGLTYLRARYYNPMDGRFVSRDTWDGSSNSPQAFNRWNYTQSNPINHTDPSGHCVFAVVDTIICAMILAGTVGGLAGAGFAAIVAKNTWEFAFDGKCSCTDTTKILMYSKSQFVARATLAGAGLGVLFGLIAGTGNGPAAGVALVGAIMTGPGIKPAWDKYKASNYQDKCAMVEFMALTIGFGASVFGGLVALGRGVTTGNWINTSGAISIKYSGLGSIKQSARTLLEGEATPLTSRQGLQTKISGLFSNLKTGARSKQTTYLWTIDERGMNIGWELTPFNTPRGNIVHSNLSPNGAYIAGEAWFTSNSTVIVNAGSGRYGDGNPLVTAETFLAAVAMWKDLGYTVTAIPLGQR